MKNFSLFHLVKCSIHFTVFAVLLISPLQVVTAQTPDGFRPCCDPILPSYRGPKWGMREDFVTKIEATVFVGARRWMPDGSAKLEESLDLTRADGSYAPEENINLLNKLAEVGVNTVSISTWVKYGKNHGAVGYGETYPTDQAYKDMVEAIAQKGMGFMPMIEFWGDGTGGTLPSFSVLDSTKVKMLGDYFITYLTAFKDNPSWKKYYNKQETLSYPFHLIESTTQGGRDSTVFLANLSKIRTYIKNKTGLKVAFFLDNSTLPPDSWDYTYEPIQMTVENSNAAILGSSIINPNHIPNYLENLEQYRLQNGSLTHAAMLEMYNKTREDVNKLKSEKVAYDVPVMFGYKGSHLFYFPAEYRFNFGLDNSYYTSFIAPTIVDYAKKSKGLYLGLANNTSEWGFFVPRSNGNDDLFQIAKRAVALYKATKQ